MGEFLQCEFSARSSAIVTSGGAGGGGVPDVPDKTVGMPRVAGHCSCPVPPELKSASSRREERMRRAANPQGSVGLGEGSPSPGCCLCSLGQGAEPGLGWVLSADLWAGMNAEILHSHKPTLCKLGSMNLLNFIAFLPALFV